MDTRTHELVNATPSPARWPFGTWFHRWHHVYEPDLASYSPNATPYTTSPRPPTVTAQTQQAA